MASQITLAEVPATRLPGVIVRDYGGKNPPRPRYINPDTGQSFASFQDFSNAPLPVAPRMQITLTEVPAVRLPGIMIPDFGVSTKAPPLPYQTRGTVITSGPRVPISAYLPEKEVSPDDTTISSLYPESFIGKKYRGGVKRVGEFFTPKKREKNLSELNRPLSVDEEIIETQFNRNLDLQFKTDRQLQNALNEYQARLSNEKDLIESGLKQSNFTNQVDADAAVAEANKRLEAFSKSLQSEYEVYQSQVISNATEQARLQGIQIGRDVKLKRKPLSFKASEFVKKFVPAGQSAEEAKKEFAGAIKLARAKPSQEGTVFSIGNKPLTSAQIGFFGKFVPPGGSTDYLTSFGKISDAEVRSRLEGKKLKLGAKQFYAGGAELIRENPLGLLSSAGVAYGVGAGLGFLAGGPAGSVAGGKAVSILSKASKAAIPALIGAEALRIGLQPDFLGKARTSGQITAELTPSILAGIAGAKTGKAVRSRLIKSPVATEVNVIKVEEAEGRNRIIKQLNYDYNTETRAALGLEKTSGLRIYKAELVDPVTGKITEYVYVETGKISGPISGIKTGERLLIGYQYRGGDIVGRSVSTVLERADKDITNLITRSFVQTTQPSDILKKPKTTSIFVDSSEKIEQVGSLKGVPTGDVPTRVSFMGKTIKGTVPGKGQILTDIGTVKSTGSTQIFRGATEKEAKEIFYDLLINRQAKLVTLRLPGGAKVEGIELFKKGREFKELDFTLRQALGEPVAVGKSVRFIIPKKLNVNLFTSERLAAPGKLTYEVGGVKVSNARERPLFATSQSDLKSLERGVILDKTDELLLQKVASEKALNAAEKISLAKIEKTYGITVTKETAQDFVNFANKFKDTVFKSIGVGSPEEVPLTPKGLKAVADKLNIKLTPEAYKIISNPPKVTIPKNIEKAATRLGITDLTEDEARRIGNLPRIVGGGGRQASVFSGTGPGLDENTGFTDFINPRLGSLSDNRLIDFNLGTRQSLQLLPSSGINPALQNIAFPPAFAELSRPAIGTVQFLTREAGALAVPTVATSTLFGTTGLSTLVTRPSLSLASVQALSLQTKELTSQKIAPFQVQIPGLALSQPQVQIQPQALVQAQVPAVATDLISGTRTSQVTRTTSALNPITVTPTTFTFIQLPKKRSTRPLKRKIIRKRLRGFQVEVRRRGKFKPLSEFAYPEQEALALGAGEVLRTSAATFRIRPSEKPFRSTGISISPKFPQLFRAPKAGTPGTFVQRRGARISSLGEVKEISLVGVAARRARRGRSRNVFFR
ncbi:MAG: hypothetical protein ACHQ1D_00935 [Nitrososphaerales archaeon]